MNRQCRGSLNFQKPPTKHAPSYTLRKLTFINNYLLLLRIDHLIINDYYVPIVNVVLTFFYSGIIIFENKNN